MNPISLVLLARDFESQKAEGIELAPIDEGFLLCYRLLIREIKKYSYQLKTKDEINDLSTDLLIYYYQKVYPKWNPDGGSKLTSYLRTKLMDFPLDFQEKYKGIKATRWDFIQHKKKNGKTLNIYNNSFEETFNENYSEEELNDILEYHKI